MKSKTKAEADRDTRAALERTRQGLARLEAKRSSYSGRELKDIDEQIKQLQSTIKQLLGSLK